MLSAFILAGIALSILPTGEWTWQSPEYDFVLLYLRLPRILLALIAGASLGLSGAVLQGYFRNPLSEPSLLGISSLGSLGAVIALYAGLTHYFFLSVPLLAMSMAFLAPFFFLAWKAPTRSPKNLILIGIGLSSFISALISLLLSLMDKDYALLDIIFWMFGSFADHTFEEIFMALPFTLVGLIVLLRLGPSLNLLTFGIDTATTRGLSMARLTRQVILGVALAVGSTVAITGVIGFVGLIVPHILRLWVGEEPRALLVPSCLGGAALALLSDVVVRFLPAVLPLQGELKVGVVTAMLGAPFFIYLLMRKNHADPS